jgi:hypothetical protein
MKSADPRGKRFSWDRIAPAANQKRGDPFNPSRFHLLQTETHRGPVFVPSPYKARNRGKLAHAN